MSTSLLRLSGNLRGALWLALAMLVLTIETLLLRLADTAVPISTYMVMRSGAQLALGLTLSLSLGEGLRGMRTGRGWAQLVRGGASLISWQLYYYSFRTLEFAVATTLNFTTSLFVALLAGPVLGERVGGWRWLATLVGFGGVLLVVRPERRRSGSSCLRFARGRRRPWRRSTTCACSSPLPPAGWSSARSPTRGPPRDA